MGRPGAAPEAGAAALEAVPAAGFWGPAGRGGNPAGPAAAGAAGRGVTLGGAGGLGASVMGGGMETDGVAPVSFAAGRGGDGASCSPSRLTAKTALQTLQRARTPPSGTLAGSTR